MKSVDTWLGKRLFHPPIIALCQRTGLTQYAVYRYIWWLVALVWIWRSQDKHWGWAVVFVLFGVVRTLSAGIAPDRPRDDSRFMRYLFWASTLLLLPSLIVKIDEVIFLNIAILFAEYALTIKTIPPLPSREPNRITTEQAA